MLFDELAELAGQRNAIDGRIVEIAAEIERDELCGATGARSVAALMAWKTGTSPNNAQTIATVAHRLDGVPPLRGGLAGGPAVTGSGRGHRRAGRPADPMSTTRELAAVATVSQLRTAVKLEPRPEPDPRPRAGPPSITKTTDEQHTTWRITAAARRGGDVRRRPAVASRCADREWKRDHDRPRPPACPIRRAAAAEHRAMRS